MISFRGTAVCVCAAFAVTGAFAENFNIPGGNLSSALDTFTKQTGVTFIISGDALKGARTRGAKGDLSQDEALMQILAGTGFAVRHEAGAIAIVRDSRADISSVQIHEAAVTAPSTPSASLETVTVTSSKIGGDVQNIPIAITALSQEQLTATQNERRSGSP